MEPKGKAADEMALHGCDVVIVGMQESIYVVRSVTGKLYRPNSRNYL